MAVITFLANEGDLSEFPNSFYLPNITLFPSLHYPRNVQDKILFIGSMSQDMNYLGIDHFIEKIWNIIIEKFPKMEFHIIGKGTPSFYKGKWQNAPNVKIRGFVEDIEFEYSTAVAAIAPIYTGAGTNIKVLEALANRCPMVVSSFAMRGFENYFIDGKDIRIGADDADFTYKLLATITERDKSESIAQSGYDCVLKKFSLANFQELFYAALNTYKNDHK